MHAGVNVLQARDRGTDSKDLPAHVCINVW